MALTQGPSALQSRALRIFAEETREIQNTEYYVTWSSASEHRLVCDCSSASTHGIFFGLKFRLRTRTILRLKVPQFRFRIQNSVWLRALKWHNSASAQGKYCGLEVRQFRFHTSTTWSFAVPLPYKSFDIKSRTSVSAQRIYHVSKFSSPAFAHRTICDFKLHSFAQYMVTWISAVPFPQEKTSFEIPHFCFCTRTLFFFRKSTLIQPSTHFLIFMLSYMNDGPSEGQRNKGIGMLLAKVVVNVWLCEA